MRLLKAQLNHVLERSAFDEQLHFLRKLAEDPIFSKYLKVNSNGGVELTELGLKELRTGADKIDEAVEHWFNDWARDPRRLDITISEEYRTGGFNPQLRSALGDNLSDVENLMESFINAFPHNLGLSGL